MNFKKFLIIILCVVTISFAAVGCNNSDKSSTTAANTTKAQEATTVAETTQKETEEETTVANGEYPIVIPHAFGETIIESKPERVVTIAWENHDTPLALGVAPVAVPESNYGKATENRLHPWADAAFKELGVDSPNVIDDASGVDFEAISDANPDVILAAYSGITEEEYNLLSEIAPVVAYPDKPWQTHWRDQTIINATGLGMKAEGEAKVAEVEALIAEKTAAYPNIAGVKAAFCWISADDLSSFYVYMPADSRASYLLDLGLEFPESVYQFAKGNDDFYALVSRENVDKLSDVDMIISYGNEELLAALQADELMSTIPAVKNGAVVLVDENSALAGACTPSILSIPWVIDDYLELIDEAQQKIK